MTPHLAFLICAAYDWRMALGAVRSCWSVADEIVVAWDRNGRTWAGDTFRAPSEEEFVEELTSCGRGERDAIDRGRRRHGSTPWPSLSAVRLALAAGRLQLRRGAFYEPGVDRMALQIRQRLAMARVVGLGSPRSRGGGGPGAWYVTLDADEELCAPHLFAEALRRTPWESGVGLSMSFLSVYKVIDDYALVFASDRRFPVCQSEPGVFIDGETRAQRWTPLENAGRIFHWHFGRSDEEMRLKLAALSPTSTSPDDILHAWRNTTLTNYREDVPRPGTCYAPRTPLEAVRLSSLYIEAAVPARWGVTQ